MQPILLFVDETYLANDTGQIQTVVPVPLSFYDTVIVPECRNLLSQFGREVKEFKGGSIKSKNIKHYKQFLRLFRNLAAVIAEQSPLRMVMTLDGTSYGQNTETMQESGKSWNAEPVRARNTSRAERIAVAEHGV